MINNHSHKYNQKYFVGCEEVDDIIYETSMCPDCGKIIRGSKLWERIRRKINQ